MRFLIENARWLSAGFLLTFMSAFGQTYFIALFGGEIRAELGLSHGEFGTIYGLATLASAIALIWVGKLADRDNLGLVAVFVSVMLAAAALGMAFVTGPIMLLVVIFVLRLFGQGMMTHVSQTAMGRWFVARRGKALAISGFGFPTSEAMLPTLTVALIVALGWRNVWLCAAGVLTLFAAPVLFSLLRANRTPQASADEEKGRAAIQQRQWTRPEVLRDPLFYALMLGFLAPSFIGTGIFFHAVHLVDVKGWSISVFADSFPLYAAISVGTAFATGWAIDRWSAQRILPLTLLPMGIGAFILGTGTEPIAMVLCMAFIGVTAGLQSTVFGALSPEIYGVRHLGSIRALMMSAMVLSSAGSPFILGTLIDRGIPFDSQLIVMASYLVAASGLLWLVSLRLLRRTSGGLAAPASI